MVTRTISLSVNGEERADAVEPRMLLVHYLRERLSLTGTHVGCDSSHCGSCTVLIDGAPAKSCTVLAVQADGAEITTVEGLAPHGVLHPVQEGFWRKHGLQCGYCTPGMIISAVALLESNPHPTEAEIREAIAGSLCRCTGYQKIVESVQWAADHPNAATRALDALVGTPADMAATDFSPAYVVTQAAPQQAASATPTAKVQAEAL